MSRTRLSLYYNSDEYKDSHVNNQSDNDYNESDNEAGRETELKSQTGDSELDCDNPVNQGHASYEESPLGGDSQLENDN